MKNTNKLILLFLLFFYFLGYSQNIEKRIKTYNLQNKIAILGYDPVAYFKVNKAIKGEKKYSSTHEGVVYYFSSNENKEVFLKNPLSFEPQYGGWCAYAMGETGDKVEINPTTFKVIEGKLYLFYNAFFNNTLKPWNKNETVLKTKADKNWKKITE